MSQFVRFGDNITISGQIIEKGSKKSSNVNGYVCTTGLTSSEIYFERLPKAFFEFEEQEQQQLEMQLKGSSASTIPQQKRKPESNINSIRNFREFVFQVWPKLDYDAHKKYTKLCEEKKVLQKRIETNEQELAMLGDTIAETNNVEEDDFIKKYIDEMNDKIKVAKGRYETERENNMKQIHLVTGNIVHYGQEVFLMHVDSKQFLNGLVKASSSDKSAFLIEVGTFFQRGMMFKFMPKYKLRREGDQIQYKDHLHIINMKQNSSISFSQENLITLDRPIAGKTLTNYYKCPHFKKHLGRQRSEIYLSKGKDITWQLNYHQEYVPPEDTTIRGGDLIYLKHTELQGFLTADITYQNNQSNAEAYLRRYEGEYLQEKTSASSIWEVEVDSIRERGQNVLVADLLSTDKSVAQTYKLRHFLTGKVLSLSNYTFKGKEILSPCLVKDDTEHLEQQSRISFVSTQGEENEKMEDQQCYLLKLGGQYISANLQVEFGKDRFDKKGKPVGITNNMAGITGFNQVTPDMFFKPLDEREFETQKQALMSSEKGITEQNAFQVQKLSQSEKDDILFIQSSIGYIQRFIMKIRNYPHGEHPPKKESLKQLNRILSELIFFIVKTESNDPLNCMGIQNEQRQKLMKDFRFIELVFDILYYPFHLEVVRIDELDSIDSELLRTFRLANGLLNQTIKENRPNEIYASQWIDLLILQSVLTSGGSDIGSEETLTELIDNNKKILERIDEATVRKFLNMLYDEQEEKYVKLVRALIICNGQAVPNQELISKLMLSDLPPNVDDPDDDEVVIQSNSTPLPMLQKTLPYIIYQVKMQKGVVYVQSPFEESHPFIRLLDFQKMASESKEKQERFDFFTEIINLMSDLCKDRNYEAIGPLSQVFRRATCFEIMKNKEFIPSLRMCFTKLVHSMYVDVSEIKKCVLPNNIRAWTELDSASSIMSVFDHINRAVISAPQYRNVRFIQEHLKSFVSSYLGGITKQKYMNSLAIEINKLTLCILQMVQLIVDFGFFDTAEQIEGITKQLFKILNSTHDITNLEEKEQTKIILGILSDSSIKGSVLNTLKREKGISSSKLISRYEITEQNMIVLNCKVICCQILKKIVLIRNDTRITDFMKKFKAEIEGQVPSLKGNKSKTSSRKSLKPFDIISPLPSHKKSNSQANFIDKSDNQAGSLIKLQEESNFFMSLFDDDKKNAKNKGKDKQAYSFVSEILQQNTIKIRGCIKIDVIAILFDLNLYEYPDLVNAAFELQNMLFTERQSMLNLLKDVQLLEGEEQIKTYMNLRRLQDELLDKVEKSEGWLFKNNERSMAEALVVENNLLHLNELLVEKSAYNAAYYPEAQNEPDGELIPNARKIHRRNISEYSNNQLIEISEEDDIEEYQAASHNAESTKNGCQIFETDERICEKNQELIRNSYMYQQIINLLKYDAATFSLARSERELTKDHFKDDQIHMRILRSCYRFLGRFTFRNPVNQKIITAYLNDFIFKHMRMLPQANVNLLIESLINNNVEIIQDSDKCRRMVREIMNCVNIIQPFNPSLAAAYLDTLRLIPYLNGLVIKENQTIIIDELTYKTNTNLLLPILVAEETFEPISKAILNLQKSIDSSASDVILVPGEIDYFNSLIFLMAVICDQKNNATESKAQSYIPLNTLSSLLEQFKNCFYVKKYLYFFFFHVYLDTEKEMSEDLLVIKARIIIQIQEDLQTAASTIDSQGFSVQSQKHGRVKISKLKQSYIFESLLLCIDTILFKKLIESGTKKQFYQTIYDSLIMISRFENLSILEKKKIKSVLIQLILKGFTSITAIRQNFENLDLIPTPAELRKPQKNLYDTHLGGEVSLNQQLDPMLMSKENSKIASFVEQVRVLSIDSQFSDDIRNEFKNFVQYITRIQPITQQAFRGVSGIDFSELTSAIIRFMTTDRKDSEQENVLSKKRLELLRSIIELENLKETSSVDQWEQANEFEEQIKLRQDNLIQQDIVRMVVEIVKDENASFDLKEEAILLGIALTFGGNEKSQQEFLNQLQKDQQNQFLGTLQDIITRGVSLIKKQMSKVNKHNELLKIERQRKNFQKEHNLDSQSSLIDDNLSDDEIQGDLSQEFDANIDMDILPVTIVEEIQKVTRIYRFLQLFCEGHNNDLQNHLRVQIIMEQESGKSIDFVYNSSLLFGNVEKFVNSHCVGLAEQILDFLIEVIQGPCQQNQIAMCRGKIIETCKDLQSRCQGTVETNSEFALLGFDSEEKKKEIDSLVNKTFKLLNSLIEGDPHPEILTQLNTTLDLNFLLDTIVAKYELLKKNHSIHDDNVQKLNDKIGSKYDQALMDMFDIYLLISNLADNSELIKSFLSNPSPSHVHALKFFESNTGSIEVVFQSKLIRVFFPIQPICRFLSKSTRKNLMEDIPRSTPTEKIEGLLEASTFLFNEMEHLAYLKSYIFYFSSKRLDNLQLFSYFLALVINITILFSYKLEFDGFMKADNAVSDEVNDTTSVLGLIQFCITISMLVFWIIINCPLTLKRYWYEVNQANKKEDVKSKEEVRIVEAKHLSLRDAVDVLHKKGPNAEEFQKSGKRDFGHLFVTIQYYWKCLKFMLVQGNFIYLLFYMIVSAMGLFLSDIVYCLHLLDIIMRFPSLQNVIRAVTTNVGQLGLTTLLGAVIIYIYTIFAFYFTDVTYHADPVYDQNGESDLQNTCTTLFQCYLFTLNKGLVSGGGVGEAIARPSYSDDSNTFTFRYIFDVTFFMIINITFLNFIFGIIIDTFAQLRDEKQMREEDKRDVCFICGLSRNHFDQVPGGFSIHIENQHHLWYYVYYIYHLKTKDSTEYNGVEQVIAQMIRKTDTSWFPLLKAIAVESNEIDEDKEEQIEEQFGRIQANLKDVNTKFDKLSVIFQQALATAAAATATIQQYQQQQQQQQQFNQHPQKHVQSLPPLPSHTAPQQ